LKLVFDNGRSDRSDPVASGNGDLLRMAITWRMWGPNAYGKARSIDNLFNRLRPIFTHCTKNRILARDLMRFPRVLEGLPDVIMPSTYKKVIAILQRLYDARDNLGFTLIEPDGLRRLLEVEPNHETVQTAYIPPRIWLYQVKRLRECIDDFIEHKEKLTDFFNFCLKAYANNFGSLNNAVNRKKQSCYRGPFSSKCTKFRGCRYLGSFEDVAKAHGVGEILEKWMRPHKKRGTMASKFSSYFSLVTYAGLVYIANFSLQRKEEVAALRTNCLIFENDQKLGRVPIICGETTKTEEESDDRWVVSPSVEVAVEALTVIANLRSICDQERKTTFPFLSYAGYPYLLSLPTEPWSRGCRSWSRRVRPEAYSLDQVIRSFPKLFDPERLRCTEEDLKLAKRLTPNLPLSVGDIWPL
jgi:hypothetical protein